MRRYRDMAALGGGMNFYGELPDSYNITVNAENPVIQKILGETGVKALTADNTLLKQATDLALLSNGMLKGKALADFIKRSEDLLN
jgi:molecular chaperone HtpG